MKKAIILLAALLIAACTHVPDSKELREKEREALEKIVSDYNDDSSNIKAEYDESSQCIKMSQKGKTLTISYKMHFDDLLGDNPSSHSDDFLISMVVIEKGVNQINSIEIIYDGIKFEATPFHTEPIGERGLVTAGFSEDDEQTRKCLDVLSIISYPVEAYFHTNKGRFKLPAEDLLCLMSMARSYIIDGGKFE